MVSESVAAAVKFLGAPVGTTREGDHVTIMWTSHDYMYIPHENSCIKNISGNYNERDHVTICMTISYEQT